MLTRPLKKTFGAALRRLLQPVVRQMLKYGVGYPAFDQIVKEVFVDLAEKEFALPYKRQTDSRLALLTGIHRKEVAKLRRRRPSQDLPEVEGTVITHVIGRWMAGPPYSTSRGVPNRLAYESTNSGKPSFSALVKELNVDIPVRAVLDELIHLDLVELSSTGEVALKKEAHIPSSGLEGKLSLLGTEPAELFATIAHNIDDPDTPWLQRKVVYDNIGSEALHDLEKEARQLGEEFIRRANALLSSYDRDRNPKAPAGERSRVAVGIYYFQEGSKREQETPVETPPPGRIRRSK